MSSTARGGKRSPADFYATPRWPVHRLLERLTLPKGIWLEPSAGNGDIVRSVNAVVPGLSWHMIELREECKPLLDGMGIVQIADFLAPALQWSRRPLWANVTIMNPPFSLAMEFIQKSLLITEHIVALLRLNFFGSADRNEFFRGNMPDCYVVPDRISFTADGKADSIEYMWAHWGPERNRRAGRIEVLSTTPLEERRVRR